MANYLLDTHVLLWMFWSSSRIGPTTRSALTTPGNAVFVRPVSIYEIAYTSGLGRLDSAVPDNLEAAVAELRLIPLRLTSLHAEQAGRLPIHHRDPLDRMLVAQAQVEGLILITADTEILHYDVPTLDARR